MTIEESVGDARILEMSGAFKVGKCPNQVRARGRGRRCDRAGPSRVDATRASLVRGVRRLDAWTRDQMTP